MNITTHAGKYQVEANGHVYGIYEADTAQAARDLCAVDAGYKSEADMVDQLEQASDLIATEVGESSVLVHLALGHRGLVVASFIDSGHAAEFCAAHGCLHVPFNLRNGDGEAAPTVGAHYVA